MTQHLDLDAHLSTCASCADRLAELAVAEVSVAASLAALPAPAVPVGLTDRITAALAAEPPRARTDASRAGPPAHSPAAPADTVTPLDGRGRARRPWLPAVAAGVILCSGAGLGYALLRDDDRRVSSTASDATGGASEGLGAGLVRNDSGLDYADPASVAVGLPGVLAGTATQRGRAGTSDPLGRLRDPAALASCLAALLIPQEPDVRPLALDYASYNGAPALAVLLPDPDPAKVSVFVVGPGCAQADDRTLFFTRLDKP
ncbi:MAG: hypothetical protein ACR2K2_11105 [Mycobacteriales bacterium]